MNTIKVTNGYVQGQVKTVLGEDVIEFLSIPYCKAPTIDRRFKKPQVPIFFDGIINDTKFKSCPPQLTMKVYDNNKDEQLWIPIEEPSEDCLYINIWCPVKILQGEENHSVFVWIYGGGFVSGSSSLPIYNGSMLAVHENIIVVSFNYRVGVLGFLCLDEDISGNQGIWDQVAALKWIHENIIQFKGNPSDITLGGNSAGGCSVTLHLIIEESWCNFNKIIVQSGVCLSDWAFHPKNELVYQSEKIVNKVLEKFHNPLRWNTNSTKHEKDQIIDFLQNMNFEEFLDESILKESILNFSWLPCVDGSLIKNDPETLFKSKKFKMCPSIFLNVENESTFFLLCHFPDMSIDENKCVDMNYLNECLKYYPWYPKECSPAIKENIIKKYNVNSQKITIHNIDRIMSDRHFVADSVRLANYVSENSNKVYYLWFSMNALSNDWPNWVGIMHGDEIYSLFGYEQFDENGILNKFTQTYMSNIGYFIKNGSLPNEMPHYEPKSGNFILIENDKWNSSSFTVDQKDTFKFWEELRKQTH